MHQRYFGYTLGMFPYVQLPGHRPWHMRSPLHDGIPEGFRRLGPITQGDGWVYNPRTELSLDVMKKEEGESELGAKLSWRLPTGGACPSRLGTRGCGPPGSCPGRVAGRVRGVGQKPLGGQVQEVPKKEG